GVRERPRRAAIHVPRKLIEQQDQREPPARRAGPPSELARRCPFDQLAEALAYLAVALGLPLGLRSAEPNDHAPLELRCGRRQGAEPEREDLLRAVHLVAAGVRPLSAPARARSAADP